MCDDKCEVYKEDFDNALEKKIEENNLKEFVVEIPTNAKKQDLVDLKVFLEKQEV
jgi:hypothetical protein